MLLVALILLPTLGSLWCYQMRDRSAPGGARIVSLATLLLAVYTALFPPHSGWTQEWLPQFGINLDLALTSASVPMLVMTPLLTLCALCVLRPGLERGSEFCGHLLLLLASLQGLFLSDNLGLFYIFFELMLLPSLLLASRWGGERGSAAALKFFLYTLLGSLPMLLGVLTLAYQNGNGSLRFAHLAGLPDDTQMAMFWLFTMAFLVKLPVFPLHGWQVDFYRCLPAPVASVVAGAMSKAGVFGLLRISLGLFPVALAHFGGVLGGLALVSLLYGGVCALGAPCLRSILAYSSLSHLALVTLAVAVAGESARDGVILQMFAHGCCTGGLFLVVAALENRGLSGEVQHLGGLAQSMPRLAALALVLTMGSLGCPGLCSFPAELAMLAVVYQASASFAALASTGVVLAGWYGLRFYQGTFNGPVREGPELTDLADLEWMALVPLVTLCFAAGLFPELTVMQWTRGL